MASTDTVVRIIGDVTVHLPGAVERAIKQEFFGAVDEFLRKSSVWREEITFNTIAGTTTYDNPPTQGQIIRMLSLFNGAVVPVRATMELPGRVVLYQEPAQVEPLTVTFVLTVSDPTTPDNNPDVPDWILAAHRPAIVAGILARMMMQPAKPYTNASQGILYSKRFATLTGQAMRAAAHKNLHGAQNWRFPRFV